MKFVCEICALKFVYIYLDFVVLILESVKWVSYQKHGRWINEILTNNIKKKTIVITITTKEDD